MHNPVVAYRRAPLSNVGVVKKNYKQNETIIVCIDCHNFEADNDIRDSRIVLRSENGSKIAHNNPKCQACGERIKVSK